MLLEAMSVVAGCDFLLLVFLFSILRRRERRHYFYHLRFGFGASFVEG